MQGSFSISWSLRRAGVVLVLMAMFSAPVAAMKRVDPGNVPKLKPDEGFVLVTVDSNIALESVIVRKDGKLLGAGVLARIPAGRTSRLYVASKGSYEWSKIGSFAGISYMLSKNPEYRFEVKAGQITYAGDLIFRPTGFFNARIHVSNRGLAAIDWLQAQHPGLYAGFPFVYSGYYPDPFPAFYKTTTADGNPKAQSFEEMKPPPAATGLPLAPEDLWQPDHVSLLELSPAGNLLALQLKEKDKQSWSVDLVDLVTGEATRMARSEFAFSSLEWASNDLLLVALGPSGRQMISVVDVGTSVGGKRKPVKYVFPVAGKILDLLENDPRHVLFASHGSNGQFMVHKVDISSAKALAKFRAMATERNNTGIKDDSWWWADGAGILRLATIRKDDETVLLHRGPEGDVELMQLEADGGFEPVALSADGKLIYGVTDEDRAQRDLVEFDIATKRIGRTVFSKPGVDIVAPLFDRKRHPVGARYYRDGHLISEYFDARDRSVAGLMENAFPGQSVAVIDQSTDAQQLVLWVDGSDRPARLYHLDVAQRRASLIEEVMPALSGVTFAPSKVIRTQGKDGLPIESYLTMPRGEMKHPLIVLAHGGPVGVSDILHFDQDVQFLASLGYAVLRVNFRGSGGFGKSFREAGHHNQGTLIEDDIDVVLGKVFAEESVDSRRMCAIGFSYGGYSALVSAVRWPDRYRCVVSVSGVSDRTLFFTASDGGRSKAGRALLEKVIGDPNTQQKEMIETSPLYQFRSIRTAVMLAHGKEDRRVDFEHAAHAAHARYCRASSCRTVF